MAEEAQENATLVVSKLPEGVSLRSPAPEEKPRVPGVELLIGCGSNREKRVVPQGEANAFENLTVLDVLPNHRLESDVNFVQWDLNRLPLPFKDNTFTSIHGYEILEHLGKQGDAKSFCAQFEEFWRILKPGGLLCATTPRYDSLWAWGDPSHTRVFNRGTLVFLSQLEYRKQVGKTPMSDFRVFYHADFEAVYTNDAGDNFVFVLKAHKPVRS